MDVTDESRQITEDARAHGAKIGENSFILMPVVFDGYDIEIGDETTIVGGGYINTRGGVLIGNKVMISYGAMITSVSIDPHYRPERRYLSGVVAVEDGAWVGMGAIILMGVRVGKNATVGAGSVVTQSVKEGEIVVGNPARRLE